MGIRKAIGKMGSTVKRHAQNAKVNAEIAYYSTEEKVRDMQLKAMQQRNNPKSAYNRAKGLANKGLDYADRVRENADSSPLLGGSTPKPKHRRHRSTGQTINIYVQSEGRKKKRKQTARFSLI